MSACQHKWRLRKNEVRNSHERSRNDKKTTTAEEEKVVRSHVHAESVFKRTRNQSVKSMNVSRKCHDDASNLPSTDPRRCPQCPSPLPPVSKYITPPSTAPSQNQATAQITSILHTLGPGKHRWIMGNRGRTMMDRGRQPWWVVAHREVRTIRRDRREDMCPSTF